MRAPVTMGPQAAPNPHARARALHLFAATLALAAGCGGSGASVTSSGGGGHDAGPPAPVPGKDAMVSAFDLTPMYFTGSDNQRTVKAPASFPDTGEYQKIILHLALTCPSGGCDPWDRFGTLGLVTKDGEDGGPDTVIELARFITPYHVGAAWDLDVTDLRPILRGDVTLEAFIDTWVGPGSAYGGGWALSATFEMTGGLPEKRPVAAIPVWTMRQAVFGDPARPIPGAVPPDTVTLPKGATSFALRSFITGHGQGNAGNCAEFCSKKHTITVGTTAHQQAIWRTDCATTAAPGQQGTYQYSRAGWCPGADVKPWILDITADIGGAATASVAYDVEAYTNTCRADATTCAGCTLGAMCAYDGGTHTEPNYYVSTLLIAYE